jgi:hypothetical protein
MAQPNDSFSLGWTNGKALAMPQRSVLMRSLQAGEEFWTEGKASVTPHFPVLMRSFQVGETLYEGYAFSRAVSNLG